MDKIRSKNSHQRDTYYIVMAMDHHRCSWAGHDALIRAFPASTPLSEKISKEMKGRGFKFVGPASVYAWMQAVGIVNDHSKDCFRRDQVESNPD